MLRSICIPFELESPNFAIQPLATRGNVIQLEIHELIIFRILRFNQPSQLGALSEFIGSMRISESYFEKSAEPLRADGWAFSVC